ncbi:putative protein of unknown function (DUF2034) [Lyophyllum shimeji]|uniref:Required for respiratory growth protein 7, mitochondrial n=1 Tax=Lyophyllum shimeji TaxID=47721 RepID=A0A9P3UQI1_LYOSH|nr:putative protein of unknown function (DUF2034) [Lyophyllum shimeji]
MTMSWTRLLARTLVTSSSKSPAKLSTTHRGTAFEERSRNILQNHLSMTLRRVGGKSDGGIDLLGWWWLPPLGVSDPSAPRRRLRVLAQCKAEKQKASPKYVREMEGVLHRYITLSPSFSPHDTGKPPLHHSSQYPVVAVLISESPFTKATLLRAQSSPVPFFLFHLPPVPSSLDTAMSAETDHKWAGTAVWNPALAGTRGLLGGEMEVRWERSPSCDGRPGLWWRNRKLRSWTPETDSSEKGDWDLDLRDQDLLLEDLGRDTA